MNAAHGERFFVGYDDFVSDTLLNRILKATSRRLAFVTTVSGTQKLLLEALAVFDETDDIIPQGFHFDAVHLHSLTVVSSRKLLNLLGPRNDT